MNEDKGTPPTIDPITPPHEPPVNDVLPPSSPGVISSFNPGPITTRKKSIAQMIITITSILLAVTIVASLAVIAVTIALPIVNILALLFILAYGVPAIGVAALLNVASITIGLATRKAEKKRKIFNITVLALSVPPAIIGTYFLVQFYVIAPNDTSQNNSTSQQQPSNTALQRTGEEIPKDRAIALVQSCQIRGLYYTKQTTTGNGGWGEEATTGVVLTEVKGAPYRISIADRHIDELVPIAREAQKTCPDLQLWHDGKYEQRQADGTWR